MDVAGFPNRFCISLGKQNFFVYLMKYKNDWGNQNRLSLAIGETKIDYQIDYHVWLALQPLAVFAAL